MAERHQLDAHISSKLKLKAKTEKYITIRNRKINYQQKQTEKQ